MIPVSEKDFLTQDPPLRGQNYACVSFIHPDQILKDKQVFFFEKYVKNFSNDLKVLLSSIEEHYPDKSDQIRSLRDAHPGILCDDIQGDFEFFKHTHEMELQREFDEAHEFRTSVQALKIRGVYDSLDEAQNRCKTLRIADDNKFNIYIAEVGCWCPWNPDPNQLDKQEFAETELNTLMSNYYKNIDSASEHYNERKKDLHVRLENEETLKKDNVPSTSSSSGQNEAVTIIEEDVSLDADPWMKEKGKQKALVDDQ